MNEKETRLLLLRQYFLDIERNSASLLEASDAISYVRWNLQCYLEAAFLDFDKSRGIERVQTAQDCYQRCPERFDLSSEMSELKIGTLETLLSTPALLAEHLHRELIAPVVAEEDRILGYCSKKIVWVLGKPRVYIERSADVFRMKSWETVGFPFAGKVPPRIVEAPQP